MSSSFYKYLEKYLTLKDFFISLNYILETMRTTIKHTVFSQQQETCWYERMQSCSSDIILNNFLT